jgi:hypothetical protein
VQGTFLNVLFCVLKLIFASVSDYVTINRRKLRSEELHTSLSSPGITALQKGYGGGLGMQRFWEK